MKSLPIAVILLFSLFSIMNAQDAQVSFDRDGKVWEITKDNKKIADVLQGYPGFVSARLFKTADGKYILEVLYIESEKTWRKNVELSEPEFEAIRNRVTASGYQPSGELPDEVQQGKIQLLTVSTLASLFYSDDLNNLLFANSDFNNYSLSVGIGFIGVSAGFFVPFFLLNNTFVTEAQGYLFDMGTFTGIGLSVGISFLVDPYYNKTGWMDAMDIVFGIGGAYLGYQAANPLKIGPGDALLMNVYELQFASLLMSVVPAISTNADYATGVRAIAATGIAGALSGLAAGYLVSRTDHYTTGDALMIQIGSLMGAWFGENVSFYYSSDAATRWNALTVSAFSTLGLVAGHYLVAGHDFAISQTGMTTLGTVAGALLGAGLSYILPIGDYRFNSWCAFAGAAGGFAIMYAIFQGDAVKDVKKDQKLGIEWSVNPFALSGMILDKRLAGYQLPESPLASATVRF